MAFWSAVLPEELIDSLPLFDFGAEVVLEKKGC